MLVWSHAPDFLWRPWWKWVGQELPSSVPKGLYKYAYIIHWWEMYFRPKQNLSWHSFRKWMFMLLCKASRSMTCRKRKACNSSEMWRKWGCLNRTTRKDWVIWTSDLRHVKSKYKIVMERWNNMLVKSAPRWSLQLRSFLGSSELMSQLSVELITLRSLRITGTPVML